jgi:hypothetical protein
MDSLALVAPNRHLAQGAIPAVLDDSEAYQFRTIFTLTGHDFHPKHQIHTVLCRLEIRESEFL